jgi:hypothetical protein
MIAEPRTPTMTAEAFAFLPDNADRVFELIGGDILK